MAIRIVTDSGADLPQEVLERYGIIVVPLGMELNGQVYQDGEISGRDFFELMDNSPELPKTCSPAPMAFANAFKQVGPNDQIICLSLSSKLSSTLQSAKLGAELAERNVWFVDSRAATLGMGILTVYAAEMARLGKGINEIHGEIQRRVENLRILIFLDTAKNIVKSGRLGKWAGSIVNMLNLKLLLTNDDGEIAFLTKIRGKKLVFQKLVEMLEEYGSRLEGTIVGISHADNLPDAEALKQIIMERFKPKEVILSYMGSCIGTHAGRGGLTISFIPA